MRTGRLPSQEARPQSRFSKPSIPFSHARRICPIELLTPPLRTIRVHRDFRSGGNLTLSTLVTGTGLTSAGELALAPDGSLYAGGDTNASDFPGDNIISATLPGDIFILKLDLGAIPHGAPAPACVVNAASLLPAAVSPGMVASLFGSNLGPEQGVSYTLDQNGLVPSQLAGMRIAVKGIDAPVLYTQSGQLNFIIPRAVTGGTATICVSGPNGAGCIQSLLLPASPGIFSLAAGEAIFNPDWTYNSETNPAPARILRYHPRHRLRPIRCLDPRRLRNSSQRDHLGQHCPPTLCSRTVQPSPGGFCHNEQGSFQFVGAAPAFINGVDQVNLNIPADLPADPYSVSIWFFPDGPATTAIGTGATIWVK